MSTFRQPLYLDTEILAPLANYYDIEVMVDVTLTHREKGARNREGGAKAGFPIPGSPSLEARAGRVTESELTESRTVKDHPTSALNRLLDHLLKESLLTTDLASGVARRDLIEVQSEWQVSPATDLGSFLGHTFKMLATNPALLRSKEPLTRSCR